MTRRAKIWRAVAAVFTAINLAGVVYAARAGERLHTDSHIALTLLGAYLMWRLTDRKRPADQLSLSPDDLRLEQLQHSVDAVAIEVERIGEAQRYGEKLRAEKDQTPH
jgi:hypothetical protein